MMPSAAGAHAFGACGCGVSDVLDLLSAGAPFDEILNDYPYLEREDILAAIEYAARRTDHAVILSA
jgi:uncharacterized protein (DUF433 family)